MKAFYTSLIQQGPVWAAIAAALVCAYILFSNLQISPPVLF